jgi:uroporphyrinogen-III synthase
MSSLREARIALLEARMSNELADLIRRNGGKPYCVPAVRESLLDCTSQVSAFIDHLAQLSIQTVVFLTGVGVTALFREAEQLERLSELLAALQKVTIVCRGPKPAAVLKRYGLLPAVSAQEPYTTEEVLAAMMTLELKDTSVAVIHYGERNALLSQTLHDRGARLEELCLYEWRLPEDTGPLRTLIQNIIDDRLDAVVFTSQVQVRHLFRIAADLNLASELAQALNTRTITASVGPTCTAALKDWRVMPHVVPEHPKMGHLIKALVDYMAQRAE